MRPRSKHLGNRLKQYFKEHGVQMMWFADKLDMHKQQFYQICAGGRPLPEKHWKELIRLTKGYVTIYDILVTHFSWIQELKFESVGKIDKCEVSLKDFNIE
jgi:hypothetical protein